MDVKKYSKLINQNETIISEHPQEDPSEGATGARREKRRWGPCSEIGGCRLGCESYIWFSKTWSMRILIFSAG